MHGNDQPGSKINTPGAIVVAPKATLAASGNRSTRPNDVTEHVTEPQTQLKKHDDARADAYAATLSSRIAKAMAEHFFKFVAQEHFQQHFGHMSKRRNTVPPLPYRASHCQ